MRRERRLFTEGYRKMKLQAVSGIVMTLLLVSILTLAFNIQPTKAEPTTIIVPDDYQKIQWAIGNASAGDTIFVRAGTYYEHIAINKSISLIGESKYNTILDGNGTGTVMGITANNVSISGFTIQNSAKPEHKGIYIYSSSGNNISDNIITNNGVGIYTMRSYYTPNFITSNIISNNWEGICLSNYGYTVLTNNTISHNTRGITLYAWMGVLPRIFHNNFINNGIQGYCVVAYALWDDGYPSGGNYWSDHNPPDIYGGPYQNETGRDKIGDIPYVIDGNETDRYPLIYPYGRVRNRDVNDDGKVNILDAIKLVSGFGSRPGEFNWDPRRDLNQDGVVNILDAIIWAGPPIIILAFGEKG